MGVPVSTLVYTSHNNNNNRLEHVNNSCVTETHSRLIQVMPADDIRRKDGELLKYKNVFSGWGKRYFRLERSYLHYYETKHSHQPVATITRGEITQVKQSTAYPGRNNVFEIVQKSGVIWYCQASSPGEMVSWMQALSTVPLMVNPAQYPMIPADQAPQMPPPPFPSTQAYPNNAQAPPRYDSPYRELMNDAHHTAYHSNTPHDCIHDSPPPPYTATPITPQPPHNPNY